MWSTPRAHRWELKPKMQKNVKIIQKIHLIPINKSITKITKTKNTPLKIEYKWINVSLVQIFLLLRSIGFESSDIIWNGHLLWHSMVFPKTVHFIHHNCWVQTWFFCRRGHFDWADRKIGKKQEGENGPFSPWKWKWSFWLIPWNE